MVLFEITRKAGDREWDGLEGEPNQLTANDLLVPSAAILTGVYFLVAGNLVLLLLVVLGALFAYNVWSNNRVREKHFLAPAFMQ